jgi:hypothetical protein
LLQDSGFLHSILIHKDQVINSENVLQPPSASILDWAIAVQTRKNIQPYFALMENSLDHYS